MDRRTFVKATLAMPLCGLLAAGCSTQANHAKRGRLTTASTTEMSSMDMAHNDAIYWAQLNIFDRLFETRMVDDEATVVNSLCTDYHVSDDGLTYDFTLREGVRFSNGDALTSSDVRYSFARLLTEASANTDIPQQILGGKALMTGNAKGLEGFVIKDDAHFSITLEAPNGGFIAELSSPAMSVVNERVTRAAKAFGMEPIAGVSDWTGYILPAIALGWGSAGSIARLVRSSVIEVLQQDYIDTARAKGRTNAQVLVLHALRNALLPVITLMAMQFSSLLSGAFITETIFSINGIGRLSVQAIAGRDIPLLQGTTLVCSFVIVMGNLVADLLYNVCDPRVRKGA